MQPSSSFPSGGPRPAQLFYESAMYAVVIEICVAWLVYYFYFYIFILSLLCTKKMQKPNEDRWHPALPETLFIFYPWRGGGEGKRCG